MHWFLRCTACTVGQKNKFCSETPKGGFCIKDASPKAHFGPRRRRLAQGPKGPELVSNNFTLSENSYKYCFNSDKVHLCVHIWQINCYLVPTCFILLALATLAITLISETQYKLLCNKVYYTDNILCLPICGV